MSILNIGTRALLANQLALQTAGNNVANVNTPGHSKQTVVLESVDGAFSGAGYYGNGVNAATVIRAHDEFLTRQAALTKAIAASDAKRLEQLKQLEDLFPGGTTGLGAAVSDMLNAFSDVVNAPTDLPARAVVLSRADELAARFRTSAGNLLGLQQGIQSELRVVAGNINDLAGRIAQANAQIAATNGSGHDPNQLLDQRDQLIRELNALVQTTSIPAEDGTIGIFIGGSQPLVLGKVAAQVSITADEFGDPAKSKLQITRNGQSAIVEDGNLGGGSVAGLLRFNNQDLVDAGNLLGRMALAIGTKVNEQQTLGLDQTGAPGQALFSLGPLPTGLPASANTGSGSMSFSIQTTPTNGATALAASDYEVVFSSGSTGTVRRVLDGQTVPFGSVPVQIDGLTLDVAGSPATGDRFLITPLRNAALAIDTTFSSPRNLAVASPVAASAGTANTGTLTLQSLLPQRADANLTQTVTLTFTGTGTFDVTGTGTGNPTAVAYTPGQPISYNGWALTLKGNPKPGDVYTVAANAFPNTSAGNAEAMLALRDLAMFDGAAVTDGYAGLMSSIGVRVQSAGFSAGISESIASNVETDRSSIAGVNLDEEAAKLLQFQQAYQASARILQVSQTMFDTMIRSLDF
ncbi:MAG: flagellar hook-associated protein FlgK [Rhodoferax sp.]|jgi:flagellar hook-associated protein 1 FlgK|nr:flagellar hook-associated protein FlgK [Rhodoferax sp.]